MPTRQYGAPEQVDAQRLGDYLEVMTKAVFQSGMSWDVVNKKWPGFQQAFDGFDAERVADYTPDDIDRLAADTGIIRNVRKIEATVGNAQTMCELEVEFGSFRDYLQSHGDFEATVKDLRKRFKFLGDFGAYYFLYVVKEPVPSYHDFRASRGESHK
jgi:3-methyladenine DNA glycosylase Tag